LDQQSTEKNRLGRLKNISCMEGRTATDSASPRERRNRAAVVDRKKNDERDASSHAHRRIRWRR
jgi:hypothetical protein